MCWQMTTSKKKPPKIGMILEQREWHYYMELQRWLEDNPHATPQEIDEAHRRLANKWGV